MILYVNGCVRPNSRTNRIAQALLEKLEAQYGEIRKEVTLAEEDLQVLTLARMEKRDALIGKGQYDDEMFRYARDFSQADIIVMAAPYWDLSFPALLKTYVENIYVTGLVSRYNEKGMPEGLCKAKKLYYVTTAGGPYNPAYSYDYLADMAKNFFGIPETQLIKAEMLDVFGFDAEKIVADTIHGICSAQ